MVMGHDVCSEGRVMVEAPGICDWQALVVRVTAFNPAPATAARTLWERLAGSMPETVLSSPHTGIDQAIGAWHKGQLMVAQQPDRSDLLYASFGEYGGQSAGVPLGPYRDSIGEFIPLAQRWLDVLEVIVTRVAFGLVVECPVSSRSEGYRVLDQLIPSVRLDADRSSDFFYQINRWRKSKLVEANVNRLTKWSVMHRIRVGTSSSGEKLPPTDLGDAVRLEMDMNTSADVFLRMNPKVAAELLDEEVALALEIAERGDVP
jgi:hypothetical protein